MALEDSDNANLKRIWRQGDIPVVFKRRHPLPVLVRVPFAVGNKDWLRDGRRNIPNWNSQFKAWETPTAWFDSVIKLCLRRYAQAYVIQLYREQQKCAPACWNAEGFHCECSCMGGEPRGRPSRKQMVRGIGNVCLLMGCPALFVPSFGGKGQLTNLLLVTGKFDLFGQIAPSRPPP